MLIYFVGRDFPGQRIGPEPTTGTLLVIFSQLIIDRCIFFQ